MFTKKENVRPPGFETIGTYSYDSCTAVEPQPDGYGTDIVIPDDEKEYFDTVRAEAIKGDIEAQMALALCYIEGKGVRADARRGLQELEAIAEKGCVDAMDMLVQYYRDGTCGIRKDRQKLAVWLTRAAAAGSTFAWEELASSYAKGKNGFPENREKAHLWFYRLYKNGDNGYAKLAYAVGLFNGYQENPEQELSTKRLLLEQMDEILDLDIFKSGPRIRAEIMIEQMAKEGYDPARYTLDCIKRIKMQRIAAKIIREIYNNLEF